MPQNNKFPALSINLSALYSGLRSMTQLMVGAKHQSRKDIAKGCALAGNIWNFEGLAQWKTSRKFSLTGHFEMKTEDKATAEDQEYSMVTSKS